MHNRPSAPSPIHDFNVVNFWEEYPQFKLLDPFKTLHDKDRSANNLDSSKIMWYLVYYCSLESPFYSLDASDKNYKLMKALGLPKPVNQELIAEYQDATMTEFEKNLVLFENKMKERRAVLEELEYTTDIAINLNIDKFMSAFPKIAEDYAKLLTVYKSQAKQTKTTDAHSSTSTKY